MPVLLGAFETSLRGGDSPHVDRKSLHKGCCGTLHGHGVAKEKAQMKTPAGRSCSLEHNESSSSGDESFITNVPDILSSSVGKRIVNGRSHSSDCAPQSPTLGPRGSHGSGANNVSKRSNSASVAQRLFTSPTLATTAKVRAERTASDNRKQHLIHGASDDEFLGSPSEIRHRQRMERRDYLTRVGSNGSGSDVNNKPQRRRKESPSPVPKVRWGDRGRRSSDESSEVSSSNSPPITPTPRSGSGATRALSATISKKANTSGAGYAFGSSTSRFSSEDRLGSLGRRAKLYTKSHSDGMSPGHPGHHHYHYQDAHHLNRTASESRAIDKKGAKSREKKKTDITKAWMQFKDDVESALQRKPNQSGFYKNLSDMMHTKMEMLNDESAVRNGVFDWHGPTYFGE
ncbi:hypothetical protein TCAL_17259 [Tigriopus californicus]|uniref:Uncharacterized protein n=1 Tax=Tigriopus californicus TaxID=6832 RepID=A0A553NXQ7_TIGCA|nr:hypothetical protein TCAL_17259 [Tigriopus californicus]